MGTKFAGTPEGEMIRLLESIERSLKSTPLTKRSVQPERGSTTATTRSAINSEMKTALKPLETAAGKAAGKLLELRDNAGKLNRTIGISRQRFFDLNIGVRNFIKTLSSAKFGPQQLDKSSPLDDNGLSASFNTDDIVHATVGVKHAILDVHKAFTKTAIENSKSIIDAINNSNLAYIKVQQDTVKSTNDLIQTVIASMGKSSASTQPPVLPQLPSTNPTTPPLPTNNAAPVTPAPSTPTPPPSTTPTPASAANNSALTSNTNNLVSNNRIMHQMIIAEARKLNSVHAATNAMNALAKVADAVTKQFFYLAEMGMGSMGNLYDLNVAAVKSGMAMRDYNDMLVKNMTLASRAGTLDNFDAITSANNKYLASLGIFGESSKRLQVGIAETATQMGIAQSEIPDTSRKLIGVFERLNKTVSMTSDEFMNSILAVKENSAYIEEAAGLNQQERSARLVELTQAYNFGRTLGLTAEESNKLGKAMMEQRKMSVQDRFKESASVMQMAALTGNQDLIPQIQQLFLKRKRTEAEEAQLTNILGRIEMSGQQVMESTNNLGYESAYMGKKADLSSATQTRMEARVRGELAGQSKELEQEAFGKHVGEFGQFVGKLSAILVGVNRNEVLLPALGALTAGLSLIFGRAITKSLFDVARDIRSGGISKAFGNIGGNLKTLLGNLALSAKNAIMKPFEFIKNALPTMSSSSSGATGILSKLFNFFPDKLNSLIKGIGNLFSKIPSLPAALKNIPSTIGSFFSNLGTMIPSKVSGMFSGITNGLKNVVGEVASVVPALAGGLKRIPFIGQFVAVAMETITGDLRNAFSPNGSWVNTVGSLILAIPYEFGNFFVNGLEWVFGENLLKPVRRIWDSLAAGIMYAVNSLYSIIADGVSWITDFLPDDSKLKTMVTSWKKGVAATAEDTGKTLDRTWNGETLSKISEENKKLASKVESDTQKATAKVEKASSDFSNVQNGMIITDPRLDAQKLAGNSAPANATPAPALATPEPQKNNSLQTSQEQRVQQQAADGSPKTAKDDDPVLTTMNSMLNVLNEILIEEKKTNALLGEIKPTSMSDSLNKLMFGDSSNAQRRLLGTQ